MPSTSPKRPMYKGLPTFRAGGVTCRTDYLREEGTDHKSALTPTYFSHDHFSSSLAAAKDPMAKRTRVTVKILEGKNLLVSDLLTGTSDPLALLWVGSCEEGEVDLKYDKRVQSTGVCKRTVDPVWDAEFIFPLEIQTVQDLLSGQVNVLVRDCDDADGDVHFVDLGRVSIPLEMVLTEGNIMAHTQLVQLPARWYPLQRCRGVKKSRGALKIAVGFFVGPDSALLQDDDSETIEQGAGSAVRFEHHIKRLRGADSTSSRCVTVSISPPRGTSRELTKRGGTTSLRPKSAPEATTLISPMHLRQRPFELKPVQPRFPPAETQEADMAQPGVKAWRETPNSSTRIAETTPATEPRPRWRDTYGSAESQRDNVRSSSLEIERAEPYPARDEPQDEQFQHGWPINSPPKTAHVRPSSKLSRLAAKATRATTSRGRSPGALASWDEQEGTIVRAHRWQRRLLESMQRLEDRSTEGAAYGELRDMVREASSTQASRVIVAARRVGATCSLSARRYTLRLLAWLCWDQQRAASKCNGDIISYVLDRTRDNETASLRSDMAVCIGAVMLSALRHGTADACMVQTRLFLRLVGEQRKSVRESAGVCCVASVLPPSPYVPIEIQTGLRSIDDVRHAIGRAAEWGRVTNAVPKEAVLLPGGCAVIELADAAAAASFFDRMTATAGGLPSNWRVDPFPEGFCTSINHAQAAHHARLTVNSEEILASLLEALGNGRSEATRGQLFEATAALAQSFALHGGEYLEDLDTKPKTSTAATGRGLKGIPATLKKGLPAIARAVLEVLDCPVRRAHTWKERKAALEVITYLAVLTDLRGTHGPLGEYRAKLIQGATRGKHDSVVAVREAAIESLVALEATEADEGKREISRPLSAPAGVGRLAESAMEVTQKKRREEKGVSKCEGKPMKNKTLDRIVRKTERAKIAAAEAAQHEIHRNQGSPEDGMKLRLKREGEEAAQAADSPVTADPTRPASSAGQDPLGTTNSEQQDPSQNSRGNLESSFHSIDGCEGEHISDHHNAADRRKSKPLISEKRDPRELDGVTRGSPQRVGRQSSEEKVPTPRAHDDAAEPQEKERVVPAPARRSAGSEVKRVPIEVAAAVPVTQPSQAGLSQLVQVVPQPQETKHLATASGDAAGAVAKVASSLLSAPMHGGMQVDTVRLLKHLDSKTDKITSVLDGLDRRLLGVERTLVERPLAAGSPTSSPPGRKLKRPRSGQTASSYRGKPNNATPKPAGSTRNARSTRSTTNLKRDIGLRLERGDIESAFRTTLSSGTDRDVLRLMTKAGGPDLCRHRLGMETRNNLFAFLARTISAGQYAEHALPWVFELVRAGETRCLSLAVRMQLAGALHGLAASPTDQGVVAARLGPYLSLTSVGRSSVSDATEGGGVFNSMKLGGCGV